MPIDPHLPAPISLAAKLDSALSLSAKSIIAADGPFPDWSLRAWRAADVSASIPRGFKVGGKKLWRMDDLRRWVDWGFPSRSEFERRLKEVQ